MTDEKNGNNVGQRAKKTSLIGGILKPESRGALAIGSAVFVVVVGGIAGYTAFKNKEPSVAVEAGGISTPKVEADAKSNVTDSYKEAKRIDNKEKFERAAKTPGGVAMPFTFNENIERNGTGDTIENCGCVIDDQQLIKAMQRLGLSGAEAKDNTRISTSDIYLSTEGQLMGQDDQPLLYKDEEIFMQANGQLSDENGIAIIDSKERSLYLGQSGEILDQYTQRIPMLGNLKTSSGILVLGDGRMAMRAGNMKRIAATDLYRTREGQLATADGRPVRHSGAPVYRNEENQLVNQTGYEIGWESQAVYQNAAGHLVNASGVIFSNPGIIFSYGGILIDNKGMLTKPLVNLERIADTDLYRTKSGSLVDGYGEPIDHYGSAVKVNNIGGLITNQGRIIRNHRGSVVTLNDRGGLVVEPGMGSARSGLIKQSDGVALDRRGKKITRPGQIQQRGLSDIYLSVDGLLADSSGRPFLFENTDTFIDYDAYLPDGSQGLITYDGNVVENSNDQRIYLTLAGHLVTADGSTVNTSGILTDSEGTLVTSDGKKIIENQGLEQVVTKDGKPVTFKGKKVFKDANGQLFDADGNPVTTSDGRAVFMDDQGNIVDEDGRLVDDVELMAGERAVKNGELMVRRGLTTRDGTLLYHNGEEVYVDDTGRLIDSEGNPVTTFDGREVFLDKDGNLVDKDGNIIDEDIIQTADGRAVNSGIIAGREQVVTKSGSPVTYNGENVFRGVDGALYDANGNPILTKDGKRLFLDEDGNIVDEDGVIVDEPLLKVAGEEYVSSGDLTTRKALQSADGDALIYNGEQAYVGDDGKLYDSNGNPITASDGRELYIDSDGNVVDADGNLVKEDILEVQNNKSKEPYSGSVRAFRELRDENGRQLYYNGKGVYTDEQGRVVDSDGNPVLTADGKEIFVDSNGNLVDEDGNKVAEAVLNSVSKRGLKNNETTSLQEVLDENGNPVYYNGKRVYKGKDGRLRDENGNLIKTSDGRDVYMDDEGNLVDLEGGAITEEILKDQNGDAVKNGLKLGKRKLFTKSGGIIKYQGKDVYQAADGSLVDANGNPILTKDGKKIFVDDNGNLVDEFGQLVRDSDFTVEDRDAANESLRPGRESVRTESGKKLLYNGEEVFRSSDGSLVDANGRPILTEDGRKIFVDEDGNLVDEDGESVDVPGFTEENKEYVSSGIQQGAEKLFTKDGESVQFKGKDVFKNADGSLVDSDGNPVTTADGRQVYMNEDGQIVDINGNIIEEDLLTSESGPVAHGDITTKPAGQMTQVGDSDLFVTRDGLMLDAKGRSITYKGKKVKVGNNGQLFTEDGDPVLDKEGNPVYLNARGQLTDASGKVIDDSILADGDGVLIGGDGKSVVGTLERIGTSDLYKTADGKIVDKDGKPVLFNGESVVVGDDGRLYTESGDLVTDKSGGAVYLDEQTGRLVDRDGRPSEGNVLTTSDGVLIDNLGELVTSGGKLTKVPGTDYYKTADGQLVDADGRAILINGKPAYLGEDGRLTNRYGSPLRYKGKRLYMGPAGRILDHRGEPVTDDTGQALSLDAAGGLVNQDGVSVGTDASGGTPGFSSPAQETYKQLDEDRKRRQNQSTGPVNDRQGGDTEAADTEPKRGKPPAAGQQQSGSQGLDQAGAERLQRRYLAIKEGMVSNISRARLSANRTVTGGIVPVGGEKTSGLSEREIAMLDSIQTGGSNASSQTPAEEGEEETVTYMKGGNFMYGVTTYQFNTDFPAKTVVQIVGLSPDHPLYNAKAIGNFDLAYEHMVLQFDTICLPRGECVAMEGVAIDPATSAAGMGSDVDHHYWYRYGGLFTASLLEGGSIAASESTTREESATSTGSRVTTSGLDGSALAMRSLGKIGERFAEIFAQRANRPVTVTLDPGSEMSIVLFADIEGPALDD